ncbi:MAG: hypothetical protein EB163_03800 [Nitrososphaeria archaeon]|nr:hypothetical protein [Nitrososphaeria archaeon]
MRKLALTAVLTLLSISLVSISFADTGCRRDCQPPTLGVTYEGQKVVEKGFTINDKSFDVSERTQTVPTTGLRTGQQVNIKMIAYENSGSEYLRDVSLSIGKFNDDFHKDIVATVSFKQVFSALVGHAMTSDSDISQTSAVVDPTGLLKDVTVKSSKLDTYRTAVDMSFKIQRPLDVSDIIIQTMDAKRETGYNVLYNAIKVGGKDITEKAAQPTKTHPPPPLKQIQNKVAMQKVECRDGFEKVIRNNGAIACVSTYTADLLRSMGQAS